jgi:hypothetical protein
MLRDFNFMVTGPDGVTHHFVHQDGEVTIDDVIFEEGGSPELFALIHAYLDMAEPSPGEPVFRLRGQDKAAVYAIDSWLEQASQLGASHQKLADAADHRLDFVRWQAANPDKVKVPD